MIVPATFECVNEGAEIQLSGDWTLAGLPRPFARFEAQLVSRVGDIKRWDLSRIERLDSVGALLLWRTWQHRWPDEYMANENVLHVLKRIADMPDITVQTAPFDPLYLLRELGASLLWLWRNFIGLIALTGQLLLDLLHVVRHPGDMPWREFSATLYRSGAQALPVTALVGFLIGVVLSYLSAIQLRDFGAEQFIVNILGIGIIREFAPVLVAILVAGRSGSAITAQLGAMRVTEEIDALATMGVERSLRLVLPRVLALSLAVPLLVVWTSFTGLLGGMLSAELQLGLDLGFFIETLARVVPIANLWIAGAKGIAFGVAIGLVACHFGGQVEPNTSSLSINTTAAVVAAITTVIILDAVFAIFTRGIGNPV